MVGLREGTLPQLFQKEYIHALVGETPPTVPKQTFGRLLDRHVAADTITHDAVTGLYDRPRHSL
jgi:hypothetical protein